MNNYIVNEESGVVVSTRPSGVYIEEIMYEHMTPLARDIVQQITFNEKFPKYPDIIKGIARLAKGDVWDEEVGKKIADAKLARKYHKRILNQALYCQKMLTKTINELDAIIAKHYKKVKSIEDDYNRYYLKKEE